MLGVRGGRPLDGRQPSGFISSEKRKDAEKQGDNKR